MESTVMITTLCVLSMMLAFAVTPAEGNYYQCYSCNNTVNEDCGDPFVDAPVVTCSGSASGCKTLKSKANELVHVERGCDDSGIHKCVRTSGKGVQIEFCSCRGSRCNSASGVSSSSTLTFGAVLLLVGFLSR